MESRNDLIVIDPKGVKLPCIYTVKKSGQKENEIIFRVFPNEYSGDQFHETCVSTNDNNNVCVVIMCNHLPHNYHEKMIGSAILQEIARYFGKRVCSYRRFIQAADEWPTDEEQLAWKDLLNAGLAVYDKETDQHWLK